ncbi:aminotransferase class IV [Georgenia faecalis]|uniref:Aminotransferase class IV n=1 Tax=Georgenia faecalis TaxID=2483799 RepID=A0ABV9DCN4_9MICO|nr:aminotransferase class IV [Georgenia faecalis]
MTTLLWHDGAVLDADTPVVSALDRGITVGDGVFETCALVGGTPFALTRHVDRLVRSATGMGLPAPDPDRVRDAVADLAAALGPVDGRLRITWTAGPGPMGSARGAGEPTLLVTAAAAPPAGSAPVRLVVVPWVRNERSPLVGIKATSYAENVLALAYARERGGAEALLANTRGELCEGSSSNVFVEDDGVLLTPPLASGCLGGVTRDLVLEWAREAGIAVAEQTLPLDVVHRAGHLAITSSLRGVVAVAAVDDRELPPGPLTTAVAELFTQRRADDLDP